MATVYSQMSLYKRCLDRQKRMEADKSMFLPQQERIAEYTRPDLATNIDTKGQFVFSNNVVEGSGAYYPLVMCRGMIANLVSATSDWRKYQVAEEELRGDDEINKWCQKLDNVMADAYRESNYYDDVLHQYALSGITVGSPIVIAEEDGGRIVFTVPHYKQCWIARDWFGRDLALHIKYKCSALEISRDYAASDHLFPVTFKHQMENGSHWEEYEILQVFYRTEDPIFTDRPKGDVEIMRHRPWVCLWMLSSTDIDKEEPLRIRYYRMQPFSAWHYQRNQGETYARTPAWFGMADLLGHQKVFKTQMQLAELKARPPIWALARLKAMLDRKPGGETLVGADEYQYKPVPFGHEGEYLTAKDFWERLDQSCRRWFLYDFFLMLTDMTIRGQSPPTATQIIHMSGEQVTQVVGAVQGIERQFLTPIDERIYEILQNAGAFPRPPDKYLWYGSGKVNPVFLGPLAQAQKRYMSMQRLNMALTASAPLFTLDENARFKLAIPDMVERIFEDAGVWQDTIVSKREYEEILDAIAQKNEQMAQFAAGKATAETMKALSGPTAASSPLAQLTAGAA